MRELLGLLARLHASTLALGQSPFHLTEHTIAEANRLAGSITDLMCAKDFRLEPQEFQRLAVVKRAIAAVFETSDFRGGQHLVAQLSNPAAGGELSVTPEDALKLYLCLSVNEMPEWILARLFRERTEVVLPIILAMLAEQLTWSARATLNLRQIVKEYKTWTGRGAITSAAMQTIGNSYMGCSYIDAPDKHEVKRLINRIVRNYLLSCGCQDLPPKARDTRRQRPKVLLIAELYAAGHAMHRVYGPAIAALATRFETVLMTGTGRADEALRPMFDVIDTTPFDKGAPRPFIEAAQGHRADLVYFPSVGMHAMSLFASNIRLAPIQFMTYGHPATTHSAYIDYAIVHHGVLVDPTTISEKAFIRPDYVQFFDHPVPVQIKTRSPKRGAEVRLAIPAWVRKVSPAFIETCQQIVARSSRPVRFVFFPNCQGVVFQAFRRRIESLLPAVVLPTTRYDNYLHNLSRCDIYLTTFPFGGTNSIVDGFKVGLPPVILKGREMHVMADALLAEAMSLPAWLICERQDAYVQAVLRLIEDEALRLELSAAIRRADISATLFRERSNQDFAEIVDYMYRHHEALQLSGKQIWDYAEIAPVVSLP